MSNAFTFGKKAFTWAVVVATIAWAMSAAFIAVPLTAKAATLSAGDLIRGTVKSPYGGYPVYYYGSDGKRHLFPTQSTYASWFGTDFSAVRVLTEAEVGAIPLGANVFIRPGSKLIKDEGSDPKVYVVDAMGVRRHVSTEAVAVSLYGAEWSRGIVLVPTGFFSTYTEGTAVAMASDYNKAAVLAAAPDIGTAMGLGATPPAATGSVSASLASGNPAAAVLPAGATGVPVMKFNLTTGSSAATVTALTLRRIGVGAVDDFTNVYLFEGATRLTSGRTISSQSQSVEFSVNWSLAANSTRTFSVVVDVAAGIAAAPPTSGDTHAFELTSVASAAAVSGLPVRGNTMSIGSQNVSALTIDRGSTPANPTIGQTGVPVSEFRLTAGVNDVEFRSVTLTVGGTVSISDLSNFELYQGSAKVASGAVSSDRVTFDLSAAPYTLAQGTNRIFMVKANVGGRGGRTISAYIDSTYLTDIIVIDKVFGVGATPTFNSYAAVCTAVATPANCGTFITTLGGRVTVAFNGPPASDLSVGSQDVELYRFSLTAAEQALEVRRLGLLIAGVDSAASANGTDGAVRIRDNGTSFLTDIKVKNLDTGATVLAPRELTGDNVAAQVLTYTDSFNINAGQTLKLVVTADVRNTAEEDFVGELVRVTLGQDTDGIDTTVETTFNAQSIREVSTGQFLPVGDIVPNPATGIQGNGHTVRASALTVQLASTPISGTTVRGSTGVQMVGFSFATGTQSAVKVTQVRMTGMGNTDANSDAALDGATVAQLDDVVISAQLFDGDTAVSQVESADTTTGVVVFDNMNWDVPAGATKKLVVRVSVATSIPGTTNGPAATASMGIAAAADITAQDKDSNAVVPTDGAGAWDNPANAAPTVLLSVNRVGALTAALDGDTPLANIVVGGTSGVSMLKARFSAANEGFWLKRLRVVNNGTDSAGVGCDATEAAAGNAGACDTGITQLKLKYPKQDGSVGERTGVLAAGVADFSDLDAYIGLDQNSIVEVQADLDTITVAGVSGDQPRFGFDFDNNFEAVGGGSSTTISTCAGMTTTGFTCSTVAGVQNDVDADAAEENTDLLGNALTVRKSKPTVTLHASSPSGAKTFGSNLEVLRFTVAADSHGSVDLARASFRVNGSENNAGFLEPRDGAAAATQAFCEVGGTTPTCATADATGLDASDFHIFDAADEGTELGGTWRLYDAAGTALDADEDLGIATFDFDRDDVTGGTLHRSISAGQSKTYVVKVTLTGASSNPDETFSLDVLNDTAAFVGASFTDAPLLADNGGALGSRFVWGEVTSGSVAANRATPTGISGFLVKNLPVTGGTIVN